MQTLFFTKQFTKGNLAGLSHTSQLNFPDVDHAARWLKAVKSPRLEKRNGWKIVDASFQSFAR